MVRLLRRVVDVRREELPALGWTWLYFYAVLASYYVLRPIRDEAGVAGGVDNLPWLWTGTLVGVAISNPAFAALVARLPRVRFVSWSYRFFALNLIVFFFVLRAADGEANIWAGRVFYVWTAVFNLFVPSVFWAFMTDIFSREQAKRLFGIISAAGTLGALTGSLLTATLAEHISPINLLLVSGALPRALGAGGAAACRRSRSGCAKCASRRPRRSRSSAATSWPASARDQARRTCSASVSTCCCSRSCRPCCISSRPAIVDRTHRRSRRAHRVLRARRSADQRAGVRAATVRLRQPGACRSGSR